MASILHDVNHSDRILQLTADTLLLVSKEGICKDLRSYSDLWFLQDSYLLGENVFELMPEETRNELLPDFDKVLKEQTKITRNYTLYTSRGIYFFKCIMNPFDGMVLCQYRDITERSNMKRQLEIANRKLQETQKAAQLGQWSYNTKKGIVYFIGNTGILARDTMQDIPIEKYLSIVLPEDRHIIRQFLDREYSEESIVYRILLAGEIYYIRIKAYIQRKESDGSYSLEGYIQNVTELEKVKRELEVAKEKAEASDRLKSAFLANMSHEIRTPLNAIVGFSRIIMDCEDQKQREMYYEVVETNNERLLQLINEILDLSKIESGIVDFKINRMNLNELCKDVFDVHVLRCPAHVELIYQPSDSGLSINSDKNRVFQVLSNLIGNAMKFTHAGSIGYGFKQEDDLILFHVTDTGSGIDPNKVGQVFDRFIKANHHVQGTGLGLSICKIIVERLGGEISVTSELGVGTTFYFTLPILSKVAQKDMAESYHTNDVIPTENESANPFKKINKLPEDIIVLVVEDTDSHYDLLNAIIGRKYKLVRAVDGVDAVNKFGEIKPDLIFMDIKMPNLDGLEATKIIRELSSDVPIIAQSAYAYDQDRQAAMLAGCNDFISKPISVNRLIQLLSKWLPT